MENSNPHIELPTHQNQPAPVPSNELPHDDEEEDHQELQVPQQNPQLLPQNPPQRPQNPSLTARFETCLTLIFGRDLEKAMKRAFRLILFFYLLFLIPLCFFTFDYYAKVQSKIEIRGALKFMSENLKADPIMDLQIIKKNSTCPAGFEPLELSDWPGTTAGCLCNSGYLCGWACSDLESNEGCQKDIPMTNSIEIDEWDGVIWCGKRAVLGQDYLKKAECPTGYKECYNGGCFQGECPITKVEIDSKGGIVLTKTQGELPLINIQTSSNDIPCFNKDFSAKSNSSYKLLNGEELANRGCDKYGFDSQYSTKLFSQSLFDSYTQDSYKNTTMNLPYYEKYTKETTSVLSWRVRMKTAKNDYCLDLDYNLAKTSTWAFHMTFLKDGLIELYVPFHLLILPYLVLCLCCLGKARFIRNFEFIIFSGLLLFILPILPTFSSCLFWVIVLVHPELALTLSLCLTFKRNFSKNNSLCVQDFFLWSALKFFSSQKSTLILNLMVQFLS